MRVDGMVGYSIRDIVNNAGALGTIKVRMSNSNCDYPYDILAILRNSVGDDLVDELEDIDDLDCYTIVGDEQETLLNKTILSAEFKHDYNYVSIYPDWHIFSIDHERAMENFNGGYAYEGEYGWASLTLNTIRGSVVFIFIVTYDI